MGDTDSESSSQSERRTTSGTTGWSIETVLSHTNALIAAHDRRYEQRFDQLERVIETGFLNQKQAVEKAETASEERFKGVNEFRATLADQQRTLMPRSEVTVMMESVTQKLSAFERSINEKVDALQKQLDALVAERMGIKGGWGYAVAAISVVIAIISTVIAITKSLP